MKDFVRNLMWTENERVKESIDALRILLYKLELKTADSMIGYWWDYANEQEIIKRRKKHE